MYGEVGDCLFRQDITVGFQQIYGSEGLALGLARS
jgi:hypothetical protein